MHSKTATAARKQEPFEGINHINRRIRHSRTENMIIKYVWKLEMDRKIVECNYSALTYV